MTLPRRLTLLGDDKFGRDALAIEPAGDIESLRGAHQTVGTMTLPANQEIVLEGIAGNAIELIAEIETNDAPLVELNVLRSPGKEEHTRIAFYRERGYRNWERYAGWEHDQLAAATDSLITLDSSYSSLAADVRSRAPETAPVYLAPNEPLKLRIFVDKSVVEVFVNGKQCVAVRVYPERSDSVGVSLRAQGKDAVLKGLDLWQMQNIYSIVKN
jgi:beta-fructofuranosidase